ncbi:MAG: bifunctional demethylmenaquinone methyltransferase/2-methoxy-6-polyprenyl-1,4-benzoquinol methylase UbiE [Rikenellaceae bacterium]
MKPYQGEESKSEQIKTMFDNIAPTYDFLNHLLTFGIDKSWRKSLARELKKKGSKNIVDIATGTGDLALTLARKCTDSQIVGVDLSPKMIEFAKEKIAKKNLQNRITLLVEDVEKITFPDSGFDAATCAFGVRNFQNIESGLKSMARVIKPGGVIAILEFSTPKNKIFATFYRFYFHKFLPFVGGLFSKDRQAYKYLPESVDEFPNPEEFCKKMQNTGFESIRTKKLMCGVAYIYYGKKK